MKNFLKIINTFLIVLIGVMSFGHVAFADYYATTTATTSGNFTVPVGVTSLTISVVGGGGGGAGGAFTYGGGGGGSGAAISNASMSVTAGQIIPYIVGIGGNGGSSGNFSTAGGNGSVGTASFFGGLISANGGNGGIGAVNGGGGGTGGTAGGVGGTNGGNGDTFAGDRHYGGNGGTNAFSSGGVGGYGSSGTYSLPTDGVNGNGGGGGSGWALLPAGTDAGSRGGDGIIIVSYYADLTAPVITINGSSTITIAAGSVYTDLGATAIDNIDGDITAGIVTNGLPINTSATGTFSVVYTSTDSAANTASSTRTVIVTDQTAPVITSPIDQTFEATGATTTPVLVPATAIENIDPSPIITYSPASFSLGTTTVVWTATDSSGNFSTSSSLVVIKDTTVPLITMNGSSTMSFMVGGLYTELGATAFDLVDGTTTVNILGSVDGNVVGTYFIVYSSSDLSGNATSTFRTIDVTPDTIAPVIVAPIDQIFEATGATTTPVLIQATSTDNFDPSPVITYAPNSFGLGTTTTVWTATDSSSNVATTTSLVTIVDTTAPVITLNGSSTINLFLNDPYIELGASSTDLVDGSIAVSATGTVNTSVTGTYNVLYTATDLSFNTSSTTRDIIVTLAPPVLTSISISPLTPSITVGATTTFVSTTLDQYSAPFATTTTWDSSDLLVGTIDSSGIFTALSAGTTTVTGTAGVLSTSTLVTVTNPLPPLNVLITNSTVEGIFYASEATTSGAIVFLTGTTTITDSTVSSSTLDNSIISTSTIISSSLTRCTVLNSYVENFTGTDCFIDPSHVENSQGNFASSTDSTIIDSNYDYSNIVLSTVLNSTVNYSTVTYSYIATSTVLNSVLNYSTSTFSNISTSTINNSIFDNSNISLSTVATSTINNSTVDNSDISLSIIASSTVDSGSVIDGSDVSLSDVSNSNITNSTLVYSTSTDSTIVDSNLNNSILVNSTSTNSTSTNSYIASSTITDSVVTNSTSTDSFITNSTTTDSTVASSTLTNVTASSSTITNSTIFDAILDGAIILNDVMSTGTITYNGTTTVVSTSTPLTALINYAPVAGFSVATSSLDITITDTTVDPNEGTGFTDSWTFDWNFGDGATSTIATSTVDGSTIHTYAAPGVYIIDLLVTDAYGATSSTSTSVTVSAVVDVTPPVITVFGSNPVTVVASSTYTDSGATALDDTDGNITGSIITINPVDANTVGVYTVTYTVSDAALNSATATRTVNVVATADIIDPIITILGLNPETVTIGGIYTDAGATSTDDVDGDITGSIITTGLPINTSATGTQNVTYTVTDGAGNSTSSVRTVNIIDVPVDTVPPVITMNGGTPITITVGSSYIDAGATAYDAVSGTTSVIEIFNDVNTSATGTYSIVYSSTDAASNTATTSRIINVIPTAQDNIAPVITITGGTPTTIVVGGTYTDAGATAMDDVDGVVTASTTSNNVDPLIIGSYTVVYSAIDVALNNATAIRDVNVVAASSSDIIPPAITITGGTPITLTVGGSYTDAGATALDDIDGVVSATTTSNDVDPLTIGSYTVVYSASDIAGNISTATRNVNVVAAPPDITPPVITMNGGTPITIALNLVYTDLGATAFDNLDGTTTVNVIFNDVNTAATGTYTVTYSATDIAGNTATTSRTVDVILDAVAPAVTVLGANPMTIIKTIAYVEAGATAVDNIDATTSVVISGSVNVNATGTYFMIYTATDSSGNSASSTRTVNVIEDNIAPVITILGANPDSLIVGGTYTDAGATALDNIDGVVSATTTANNVDVNVVGTYTVDYSATDAMGNIATTSRTVNVNPVDVIPPVITILGSNPVTVLLSAVYTDAGATALDNVNGNVTGSIVTTNLVNTAATGTYTVTYVVSDAQLNTSTSTRIVNVVATPDVTLPVITILGSNPDSLLVGGVYTDAGATATDDIDGDITSNITSVSTVNTAIAGIYSVVYTIVDGAGNSASSTRVVNINNPPTPPSGGGGGGSIVVVYVIGDLNHDGKVDEYDFSIMMSQWGQILSNLSSDLNHDGKVDEYDFSLLIFNWK